MVFGSVSTLHLPIAGSAGSSLWGTDVRKLLDAADATSDGTTINSHGTGGAVTRTCDPYTTSSADLDQTLYGWAIAPTDMGSTADFIRSYPAGNHVLTARMSQNAAIGADVTVTLFAYRVGPSPTRTRTLLGSASTVATLAALSTVATVTVTLALSAITFAADETIQYSVETNVAGAAITGRNVAFWTGTQATIPVRIDTPQLKTTAAITGDSTSTGTALGTLAATAEQTGTGSGTSTVLGVPTAVTAIVGTSDGTSTALGVLGATGGLVGSSVGTSSADGALGATAGLVGSAVGVSVVTAELSAVGALTGTAVGTSTAEGVPSSVAGTIGAADGFSLVEGVTGLILATVGTVGGDCPECPSDWFPNDGLKQIQGDVFFHEPPNQGDPVTGATVTLIRDSDGLRITDTLTDVAGHYTFPRDSNDPYTYHVEVNWTDGGTPQQGLSQGGCVPV